jgi:hypothetical protein
MLKEMVMEHLMVLALVQRLEQELGLRLEQELEHWLV